MGGRDRTMSIVSTIARKDDWRSPSKDYQYSYGEDGVEVERPPARGSVERKRGRDSQRRDRGSRSRGQDNLRRGQGSQMRGRDRLMKGRGKQTRGTDSQRGQKGRKGNGSQRNEGQRSMRDTTRNLQRREDTRGKFLRRTKDTLSEALNMTMTMTMTMMLRGSPRELPTGTDVLM